ncbi:CopG family transcriptional regulator [Moraxella osloensis]|jgi:metal-responsive CopG/Arc/MetJ family transcriptional regulator|nr:ribbon-helix-helix domain-containing protein [Moraxella osloensis]MBW4016795.1 CopG family transcriptional regulator [Moraxella osloensis]MBW4019191.1 CopG family transcriptional regulator [Moraxella osloensis]TGP41892.1 CopG family transcriptional regulator [bacterium M00.F.Ca.ET.230.01.1.1]VWX31801.1 conserved hypothetical protein [Moraxellaceae bacterium 17A]
MTGGNQPKQTVLTVRMDSNLAEQFKKISKENNRNQSQLVRDWVLSYVKKNGQGDLFK